MKLITSVHINTAQEIGDTPVYERLELFDFESIELTSSIQDVRDIGSVFTDFSQQFTIPASQTNNRLLNHFYNESVTNGYDARIKRKGYITLNGITFRDGYIRLSEAILRNGKPYSYSITFFGQIVSLKDILGDDELKALTDLSIYNHDYDLDTVYKGFTEGLGLDVNGNMVESSDRDVIYPSISCSNKWYYNTSNIPPLGVQGAEIEFNQGYSKNLYVTNHNEDKGLKFTELKAAIKVKHIIDAIDAEYSSINFRKNAADNDFFASDAMDDLYFYVNKNKGDVQNLNDINESLISGFEDDSDLGTFSEMINGSMLRLAASTSFRYISLNLTIQTASSEDYTLIIVNSGNEIYRQSLTGNNVIDLLEVQDRVSDSYTIYIAAETAITFSKIQWDIVYDPVGSFGVNFNTKSYNTGSEDFTNVFTFDITRQMPKMKIIDFLKGLFNMFNLTAYVEGDEIVVKTLNDFYADGNTIDLSNELDLAEVSVKRAELYSNIDLNFSKPKTFGVIKQNEIAQDNFGNSKFQATVGSSDYSVVLDGGKYEIKLPFEKLLFEKLSDGDDGGNLINFSHGWLVDKDQNEVSTAPALFYNINTTIDSNIEIGFKGKPVKLPKYNRPSNSNADGSQTIHFDAEIDEFTTLENKNSLYKTYYDDYLSNLFDRSSRLVTYNTVLKLNTLLSYNMNDLILINGKEYRINTIKTNLSNGKSEIELLTNYEITT